YPLRMDPGGTGMPPVGALNDYPKFGVWNDGCLYMSANEFMEPAGGFIGTLYASLSLRDMESGLALTWAVGFNGLSGPASVIPSNLLGVSPGAMPPAGTPNYFVSESLFADAFEVRKFTPGANCGGGGVLSPPVMVAHVPYNGATSIPQPNTTVTLDS